MRAILPMVALLAFGSLALASPAAAEMVRMRADLAAATEVPPNGSPARGTADVTLDTATRELTWRVSFSDLSAPMTMMHFHGPAAPGTNAGIAIPIPASPAQTTIVNGSATITEQQMADLLAGRYYINVHTPTIPAARSAARSCAASREARPPQSAVLIASRRPDRKNSRCSGSRQLSALGSTTGVRVRSRPTILFASSS
jgi:hypothetical protein